MLFFDDLRLLRRRRQDKINIILLTGVSWP